MLRFVIFFFLIAQCMNIMGQQPAKIELINPSESNLSRHLGNEINITIKITIPVNSDLREISINDKTYKRRPPSSKFFNTENNGEELDVRAGQGVYTVKFTKVLLQESLNITAIYFDSNVRKKLEKQISIHPELEKQKEETVIVSPEAKTEEQDSVEGEFLDSEQKEGKKADEPFMSDTGADNRSIAKKLMVDEKTKDVDKRRINIKTAKKLALSDEFKKKPPQLLSRYKTYQLDPLPFVSYDIYVVVTGHRARIVYDMVFKNPTNNILAGTLMIELPNGASPCYVGMFQGYGSKQGGSPEILLPEELPGLESLIKKEIDLPGKWSSQFGKVNWGKFRPAKVVNPVKGKMVYEKITRRRVDPALSEWAGSNKFSTRIYPLAAQSYKRVVFAYELPLESKNGNLYQVLPLPEKTDTKTRVIVYAQDKGYKNIKLLAGKNEVDPIIKDYGKAWVYSSSYDLKGSLILYANPTNPKLQYLVGTNPAIPGKLVHIRYVPDVPENIPAQTGNAVFVLDTSYSTKNKLTSFTGRMLKTILEQDKTIKNFAVISFDVVARKVTENFWPNTKENREKLYSGITNIWLEGATDFESACKMLNTDPMFANTDAFFLLSDGQITWGCENIKALKKGFATLFKKRWLCYSFGDIPINSTLFENITKENGQIINVGIGQDLTKAALFHQKQPASLEEITTSTNDEILVAGEPKWVYPGQILKLAIRVAADVEEFDINFKISGKKETATINLNIDPISSALGARAWADIYVKHLLGLYNKKADKAVLALSQTFSLTNREASFIILETDQEYKEHKIESQMLSYAKIIEIIAKQDSKIPYGTPDISKLGPESHKLFNELSQIQNTPVWNINNTPKLLPSFQILKNMPLLKKRKDTPSELYKWADDIYESKQKNTLMKSLRVLSTIIELKPRDDNSAGLVSYVLLSWGLYDPALSLLTRIRQRRPFEGQNYLMEGMALAALGKIKEAAIRYEIVLKTPFDRFDSYLKPLAKALMKDLLTSIEPTVQNFANYPQIAKRLDTPADTDNFKGWIYLFWNLDNTDVDLHVQEDSDFEVYYSQKNSPTGGILFWDNTTGLGPEFYGHPKLSKKGFNVFVNYFGSGAVEGAAPSATLVCAFEKIPGQRKIRARWYSTILMDSKESKVHIMPLWRMSE